MTTIYSCLLFDKNDNRAFNLGYGYIIKVAFLLALRIAHLLAVSMVYQFKPSSKIFYWPFQGGTSFVDLLCFCSVLCLLCPCASVYMCFVVTCWERADLLALVCGVFCEFVTFPLVSWVRCGTWLYRFLIFAPLLTFTKSEVLSVKLTKSIPDNCPTELAWTLSLLPLLGVKYSQWT